MEIIERVREVGLHSVLPKYAARGLPQLGLAYYDVGRRIMRMNRGLKMETGELLFEKRGHKWALTSFGFESWGTTHNRAIS